MFKAQTLQHFLDRNHIDSDSWEKAHIDWRVLQAIANDHESQFMKLESAASDLVKQVQKFEGVHSVRWRVKDTEHLLEKIVRKRGLGVQKYGPINQENYFEIITDLVGIRALHLFKEDCFKIDRTISRLWNLVEKPVAYIRKGDSETLKHGFDLHNFEVKEHPAGYRSIHYVIGAHSGGRKIISEIQVRTLFEEGWSEVDHTVKYPNFSHNVLIGEALAIFNRLAGSADDMAGFVLGLAAAVRQCEEALPSVVSGRNNTLREMAEILAQLENANNQDAESRLSVAKLKEAVADLKKQYV